ncbi:cytochrome C oxidase subunit IV [Tessaracoccus aquimaris]|uniref:Cytochrome c oxidase polypeptide 4 n=1 Tax=Tessaracoccus aquimaris TaxID=1332264 RepID=A0A1Q2CN50_9ACTN|nr:cytochrome c oxidase subunit 4 [Tessaracoccus aquimaris]AQP47495.1 cytochrome C oxidase subunit IV [Tessaracoccus aquimaris]
MKAEKWVFWFIFLFFLVVTPVYYFMSREIAGTFVLGFTGLLGGMIAGYLTLTARSFDPRPEDRPDAEVYEAAGNVGFFAPKSMWPFWCALVVAVLALGPAMHQAWITLVGVGIGIWALSGWVLEFYRGDYKH